MKSNGQTEWNLLLDSNKNVCDVMVEFASGIASARKVTAALAGSRYAGEFRHLIRLHGVDNARNLTTRALRRRGLVLA